MKSAPKSYPELVRKLREIKNLGWVENTRPSNIIYMAQSVTL